MEEKTLFFVPPMLVSSVSVPKEKVSVNEEAFSVPSATVFTYSPSCCHPTWSAAILIADCIPRLK
jgi:hypothetical protein